MNPADILTRGLTSEKFKDINDLWMNGPAWICNENEWPVWNGNTCFSLTTLIEDELFFRFDAFSM
jgi:hypothetical protein